jgi:uncharacterized protein (DUF736 family)
MQIGELTRTRDGYAGRIKTITLDFAITLVPADPTDTEDAPDYRVHLGEDGDGPEIGAGWNRTGERAGAYVAVQLDDPAFVQPLRANLFRSGADDPSNHLIWNRSSRRESATGKADDRS